MKRRDAGGRVEGSSPRQTDRAATRIEATMSSLSVCQRNGGEPEVSESSQDHMKVDAGMLLMMCSIKFN